MNFNPRSNKGVLKPISRRTNYLNNFTSQAQFRNRSQYDIVSNNVNLALYDNDIYVGNAMITEGTPHKEGKEKSEVKFSPTMTTSKTVKQKQRDELKNSKNLLQQLYTKKHSSRIEGNLQSVIEQKVLEEQFSFQAINELFLSVSHDKTKMQGVKIFLEKVQGMLGLKQAHVIDQTMKKLQTKQLLKDQSKVYISSQCLVSILVLIKYFNAKEITTQLMINPFVIMNTINKDILEYLKSKYPRNKNIFVPRQLQQKFDNVNFLSLHENNMLVNTGISFTNKNASRRQVLGKTKNFFNLLMNELNDKFSSFENLLNGEVFKFQGNSDIKLNKVKIGRKIPENTEFFYQFDTENFEITSPQLFRVMIKWIQNMEELLLQPQHVISKRRSMKFIKKVTDDGKVIFDEIQSKRFDEIKIEIIEKIASMSSFKNQIQQLINKLNTFNNNLTKTLYSRSPKTKFIKEEQAETMKFAKFNTMFLEWLIVEKFLIIIKTLSDLSDHFQSKYYKKIDFINFNVFDLMRASFSGKKSQITEVFRNLKTLEENNQIEIVRVKNRLSTPLNDVMINFKMHNSFVICELQLILVDILEEGQQKLKIMEGLNHTIYQLQRSPYGSLSEMALIMGYYDPSINYEKKILFKEEWDNDKICRVGGGAHQFMEIYDQQTPFVCSWCVKFYGRYLNFFDYHQCRKCSLQKCKSCVFRENIYEEKRVYYKYFASRFLSLSLEEIQNEKDDDFIDNFFIRDDTAFIHDQYIKVRDHIELTGKTKLQQLEKLLHAKQIEYDLKATQPFYALFLQFSNGKYYLHLLKYVNYKVEICSSNKQYDKKMMRVEEHDAIFVFRKRIYLNSRKDEDAYIDRISSNQNLKIIRIVDGSIFRFQKSKAFNVVCIVHRKKFYGLEWIKVGHVKGVQNFDKIFKQIDKSIKKCDSYKAERSCIQLNKIGLSESNLNRFYEKHWVQQVKVLNLGNNQISNCADLLTNFTQLTQLYLEVNLVKQFYLPQKSHLKVLDLSNNELLQISSSIHEAADLCVLKVSSNYIKMYPIFQLLCLQQLDLSSNQINSLQNLFKSEVPNLQILNISYNSLKQDEQIKWNDVKKFMNLRKLQLNRMKLESQQSLSLMYFSKLEYLDFSRNKVKEIVPLYNKYLREVKLYECKIASLHNVFTDKLILLENIEVYSNQIQEFPILELTELHSLKLNNNRIRSLNNIEKSYLPKLKTLDLQSNRLSNIQALQKADLPYLRILLLKFNRIGNLPRLQLPQIQLINLTQNQLVNIDNITDCQLPKLRQLLIKHNKITKLPKMKLDLITEFSPCQNEIDDLSIFIKSHLSSIKKLNLYKNNITTLPILDFANLETLLLFKNKLVDIKGLELSVLNKITMISLYGNQISALPILKFPYLSKFYAYKNKLVDIENLNKWQTPSLSILDLNTNMIQKLPKVNLTSLYDFELSENKIENIKVFCQQSQLFNLRKLFLNDNKIKNSQKFMNFPKMQQIQLNNCKLCEFLNLSKSDLPQLKKLFLDRNEIKQIPQLYWEELEELSVRFNKIQEINCTFQNLSRLKKLNLSSNKIREVYPDNFYDCQIEDLYLSKNPISKIELPETMNLRILALKGCGISSLQGLYLPNLCQLYLNFNEIKDLNFLTEPGAFLKLKKVHLQQNQIKTLPSIDLPELADFVLYENPLEQIAQILSSVMPNLRNFYLNRKISKSDVREPSLLKSLSNTREQNDTQQMKQFEEEQKEFPMLLTKMVATKIQETDKEKFIKKFKQSFPKSRIKI